LLGLAGNDRFDFADSSLLHLQPHSHHRQGLKPVDGFLGHGFRHSSATLRVDEAALQLRFAAAPEEALAGFHLLAVLGNAQVAGSRQRGHVVRLDGFEVACDHGLQAVPDTALSGGRNGCRREHNDNREFFQHAGIPNRMATRCLWSRGRPPPESARFFRHY
jgi:hypothetical protein